MKNLFFALFFILVIEVSSQIENVDIQQFLEVILNKPQGLQSQLNIHPDTGLNISQFLEKYGYPLEYHDVTTKDGHILTLHRIPYGKNERIGQVMANKTKPVTFLVHCFACSSMDYVWQGPNISLAFLLADSGYDVWLANTRGNVHSMSHSTLTFSDKTFWDYSFHEKGYYDMPASIDYILNYTSLEKLTYIGHSQGTTQSLVMTSLKPEYNEKINLLVLLSPIAYLKNVKSPLILLLAKHQTIIKLVADALGIYGIPYGSVIPALTKTLCNEESHFQSVCIAVIDIIVGFDTPQIDKNTLTVFLTNTPNGVSIKEIQHFGQEIVSGYFRQFDYGTLGNIFHYGSLEPPSYDLSKVTVPIAAYYGKNDYLLGIKDVEKLFSQLPNRPLVNHLIEYELFNHLDFVTAKDVKTLLYDKLIEDLKKFTPNV